MTIDDITALTAQGETAAIEFKRTTGQRSEGAKSVCAMLNGTGGIVLYGVRDDGVIIGQQVTARTVEEVAHELRRIDPPVFPTIETITLNATHAILAIHVTTGNQRPYTFDGRPYLRHGPTTQVMPRAVYEQQLTETMHPIRRWENQLAPANVRVADQIALRAYEIFQSRGGAHGSHLEDWLLAERELDAARGGETARADDK